jgi:hypothetical protein
MFRKLLFKFFKPLGYHIQPNGFWHVYVKNMSHAEQDRDAAFATMRRIESIIDTDFKQQWSTGVPAEALTELKLALKGYPENIRVLDSNMTDEEYAEYLKEEAEDPANGPWLKPKGYMT